MSRLETLADLLRAAAAREDAAAVVTVGPEGPTTITYGQFASRVADGVGALQERGLQPGERVLLWAENSVEWTAAALAVICAGAVATPVDVQLDRDSLRRILDDCEPRFLCTAERRLDRVDELDPGPLPVLVLDAAPEEEQAFWHGGEAAAASGDLDPEAVAVLFYTSGTTGPPKGVPLSHRNLVFQLNRLADTELILATDRFLVPLPFHHVYPFSLGLLLPLSQGVPIVLPQALTGREIARAAREGRATALLGVPRLHRALLEALEVRLNQAGPVVAGPVRGLWRVCETARRRFGLNLGQWLLAPLRQRVGPDLRVLASGGGPLDPDVAGRLEALGWDVAVGYGLTETSPLLTINPPGSGRYDAVGRPLEGVELRIAPDPSGSEGEAGEVLARGPGVFAGYRNLPEATEEAFTEEGWFRTGDLGLLDADGFLHIQGRVSTRIVTESGENVQPEAVEEVYQGSPALAEVGVLQREGRLAALVVPEASASRQGAADDDLAAIVQEALEERGEALPSHQRVTEHAITERPLPRTRLGKIRRHLLAERYAQARAGEQERAGREPLPVAEMEGEDRYLLEDPAARAAWEVLAERYPEQGLSPDSRLGVDLGIDSLDWLGLGVAIGERAGVELDEEAIGSLENVRDLLREVSGGARKEEQGAQGHRPLEEPEATLSEEQRRWLEPPGPVARALGRATHRLLRPLVDTCFSLQIQGRGALPTTGPFVIAPNHLSILDPVVLAVALEWPTLERTHWAGWTGIAFRNAVVRRLSRVARVVPVDPQHAVASSLAFAAAVLRREGVLVWFPEGRRSPDGTLQPFQPGIGLLLEHYEVPVVPTWLAGTREALAPGRLLPRPRQLRLTFGEPVEPRELAAAESQGEPHERIAAALRQRVAELGAEHRVA